MEGIIIGVVIIWLACAFGCAAIANSKGKSVIGWFLLGLLLGVIGILIIGFMRADEWAVGQEDEEDRIEKLKVIRDADGLAKMMLDESDDIVCFMAAEALAELGDERGKRYLEHLAITGDDEED